MVAVGYRYGQCCESGMFIPDPGSDFFPSRIPDPNCLHPGSRIRIKEFTYFNSKKWFLRSRKYYPGCSSRIRMLTFYPSRIPDSGVKKAPDPGSGSATLGTVFGELLCLKRFPCFLCIMQGCGTLTIFTVPVPTFDKFRYRI
jgi:hypothetical protein